MDDLTRQIEQIRTVRALRVRARRREQAKASQEVQLAALNIEKSRTKISVEESQAITFQRDGMSKLTDGNLVNIERLMDFNTQKLKSIKRIADAKIELVEFNAQRNNALEALAQRVLATQQAEKKLLGIEEVIENELWK